MRFLLLNGLRRFCSSVCCRRTCAAPTVAPDGCCCCCCCFDPVGESDEWWFKPRRSSDGGRECALIGGNILLVKRWGCVNFLKVKEKKTSHYHENSLWPTWQSLFVLLFLFAHWNLSIVISFRLLSYIFIPERIENEPKLFLRKKVKLKSSRISIITYSNISQPFTWRECSFLFSCRSFSLKNQTRNNRNRKTERKRKKRRRKIQKKSLDFQ